MPFTCFLSEVSVLDVALVDKFIRSGHPIRLPCIKIKLSLNSEFPKKIIHFMPKIDFLALLFFAIGPPPQARRA
jgi:hypothetical protein